MKNHPLSLTLHASLLLLLTAGPQPALAEGGAPSLDTPAAVGEAAASTSKSAAGSRRQSRPAMLTDPNQVFSIPAVSRPGYLLQTSEPTFGSLVMRIANNTGLPTTPVSGTWGADARHHYSKDQPWNADQSLFVIQNREGGSPNPLFLDGTTYLPRFGKPSGYSAYDFRWHPSTLHKNEQINVTGAGTELMWFDVVTGIKTRTWTLPFAVQSIGRGEGNPSFNGRYILLADSTRMFVVDMDPQPPFAPYPNKRIGPAVSINECGVGGCSVDWVSISPSGKYAVVSYSGDYPRVFDVNPNTLALTQRPMPSGQPRCHGTAAKGFIYDLGHADMTLNPFDANQDVLIGQEHCGNRGQVVDGKLMGSVVMVRLSDGEVTPLTNPANEAYAHHISTRNYSRLGWAYVGYYKNSGKRFSDEIVAVKLDGSGAVERLAHKHSLTSGCYRCESHAVPSPDGQRVIFASNWAQDCGSGCMPTSDIKDYVVWQPTAVGIADPPLIPPGPDSPGLLGFGLRRSYPNPAMALPTVEFSLDGWDPARIELIDVTGRVVLQRDLGTPGPGHHAVPLGPGRSPTPGIYWLRLLQGGRSASSKVVFIHR